MRWLVVLLLLAGCLGGPTAQPGPAGPSSGPPTGQPTAPSVPEPAPQPDLPMLLAFDYRDCEGQLTHMELPPETAQAVLPEGHDAWTTGGVRPMAVAEYLWVRCQTFSTAQVNLNETVYGHVAVRTVPREADPGESWYRLRMLTAGDLMEAVWTAAAYDVYRGDYADVAEPVPRTVTLGEYVLEAIAAPQEEGSSRQVTYHTEVDDGRLEWRGQIEVDAVTASGRLQVPADDAFADAVPPLVSARLVSGDFVGNDLWLRRA